ncbi:MAG: hypothetical protein LJE64_10640 [Desulfofustis sp.]|nr:hypothetical protein [Desulfofustis sp.]
MKVVAALFLAVTVIFTVIAVDDQFFSSSGNTLISSAEAIVGRPMTPISYAGVARRSPVGVGRVGNRGGPVNRVGRW